MSVRHVFAEIQFIDVKCSYSNRDGRKHIMFVYFIKAQLFYDIVSQDTIKLSYIIKYILSLLAMLFAREIF